MTAMKVIRGGLRALALATLSGQLLIVVLATVIVCSPVEHRHNGAPAPDCPMHHQHGSPAEAAADHHHHGGDQPSDTSRMTCACPGDVLAMLASLNGIMVAPTDLLPSDEVVAVPPANHRSIIDVPFAPLAPPPRA